VEVPSPEFAQRASLLMKTSLENHSENVDHPSGATAKLIGIAPES